MSIPFALYQESAEYLRCEMHRIAPFKNALSFNILCQRDTVYIFHYDVLYLICEAYIVNFYYIFM